MYKNTSQGFTLIELVITLAISTVLMGFIVNTIRILLRDTSQQPLALQAIDQVRILETAFASEIRSATIGSDGSYPIVEASSSEIIFFAPQVQASTTIQRIRYFVFGGKLYKGVTDVTGTPPAYVLSQEQIKTLFSVPTSSNPLFTYYNSSYTGMGTTTALLQPVSVTDVTFVQMSIDVLRQETRNSTSTFTMTTGGAIRNLKTNLGN